MKGVLAPGRHLHDFLALGTSTNDGSFTKTFRFNEMAGPLACPDGSAAKACEPMFSAPGGIADQFDVGKPDAGVADVPDAAALPAKKSGCGGCSVSTAIVLVIGVRGRRRRSALSAW